MTIPNETGRAVPVRIRRRIVRILLLFVVVAALVFLAVASSLRG